MLDSHPRPSSAKAGDSKVESHSHRWPDRLSGPVTGIARCLLYVRGRRPQPWPVGTGPCLRRAFLLVAWYFDR
jgi:hypothetical protein